MLKIGSISLPLNSATKTFAVLGKRGAGKTYTAGVLAEEFHKNNIPFVVMDPIDVWWGLRLNKNGKDKGLPVVVFGLEHADIEIDRNMGRMIAQEICRQNISCVISTFGMPKVAQRHLTAEFADELININKTPRHVLIEEAHEFVPQRVHGAMGKCFAAVEALVVMGRNRGIGVTLINQRAATINKDVLTQLDTLIALRSLGPQDRKALMEWVEQHAAKGDFNRFINSLPSLPTGEAWIWSPEFLGMFERIKIRPRETFHPDREKLGENFIIPDLNQVDVQEFIERFNQQKEKNIKGEVNEIEAKEVMPSIQRQRELIDLKNEYESKIMQKDLELQNWRVKIAAIQKIIGNENTGDLSFRTYVVGNNFPPSRNTGSNLDMWLQKLGKGGTSRILQFLAEKSGMKFTRSQIGLAVGLSPTSGSFGTYMSTLKRNKLIIEQSGDVCVNPDL